MDHTPVAEERAPAPAEEKSFWHNLRHLWSNFRAAMFRTGAPTSDRARTQKVFGNFLFHIHSTRVDSEARAG